MCLIIYKPADKSFNLEHVGNALNFNSDGMGISINYGDRIEVKKGLTLTELIGLNDYLIEHEVVLHLRYGTSGPKSIEQIHPFKMGKKTDSLDFTVNDNESLIFHNGIMFNTIGMYSDTQVIARAVKDTQDLEKYLGSNRFLIQTNQGIELMGKWHDINGLMYSNTHYHGSDSSSEYLYEESSVEDDYLPCPCCGDFGELISYKNYVYECLGCDSVFNENEIFVFKMNVKKAVY